VFSGARRWGFTAICLSLWTLPFVVTLVRAVSAHWYPIGDEAFIAIRARDVFTKHHPLIGTATSAALGGDVLANHPGPIFFDLAAAPVRVLGAGTGLALAAAIVNVAAGAVAIVFGGRRLGHSGTAFVTAAFLGLAFVVGDELLRDPYNPTVSMFPFLACLVLVWAAADADRAAPAWLIAMATFCVQTNISYVIVVVPLVAFGLGSFTVRVVHCARADGSMSVLDRLWRPALWSVGVFVILWSQPLAEQLIHGGDGNIARLWRGTGSVEPSLGWRHGTEHFASISGPLGRWTRRSLDDYGLFSRPTYAWSLMIAMLSVAAVGLVAIWVWRRNRTVGRLLIVAAISLLIGWLATVYVPLSPIYGFATDYVRWLWPIAVFAWSSLAFVFVGPLVRALPAAHRLTVAVACMVALSVATVPPHQSHGSHEALERSREFAGDLNEAVIDVVPTGGVAYDPTTLYPTFGISLLAALREHDVPFWVDDDILVRQLGEQRLATADLPVVRVAIGLDAIDHHRAGTAIAFVSQWSDVQLAELERTSRLLSEALSAGEFDISALGDSIVGTFLAPDWFAALANGYSIDGSAATRTDDFLALLQSGALTAPARLQRTAQEFLALRADLDLTTAAAVLDAETT
jgi:hypothetical protein